MAKITRKQLFIAAAPAIVFVIAGTVAAIGGYRINTTPSLPMGIWKVSKELSIQRGHYVSACIDPAKPAMQTAVELHFLADGHCKGGYAPLLKQIVAVPGDTVTLTDAAVTVNGKELPNTATMKFDFITELPSVQRGTYTVQAGHVWLIANENPRSFDSRYFGPVSYSEIEHTLRPALTY